MKKATEKKLIKVIYNDAKTNETKAEIVTTEALRHILRTHNVESWKRIQDLSQFSFEELVLHAVLLLRTVNRYQSKEEQLAEYKEWFADKKEDLMEYIYHFDDPQPEIDWDEACSEELEADKMYYSSCTACDYGPSCPWNAPGMSVSDFI